MSSNSTDCELAHANNSSALNQGRYLHPHTPRSDCLAKWKKIVDSFPMRILTLLAIFMSIIVVIIDVVLDSVNVKRPYRVIEVTDFCFTVFFVTELSLRIATRGDEGFFRQDDGSKKNLIWQNVIDVIIVASAFSICLAGLILTEDHPLKKMKLIIALRIIRVIRIFTEKHNVEKSARLMVSSNKRRFTQDGFDLDLTYVTEQVIAMSYPSNGRMSLYRNPINEVVRFFDTKHTGHYKIYNLCSERSYKPEHFNGPFERFKIDDHFVPTVKDMLAFTQSVRSWLHADASNVIAVHCKGGKGRTGTMICCWLLESGFFESARDALEFFGKQRTDSSVGETFQGVETPSQCRYVGYYERIKRSCGYEVISRPLRARSIIIQGVPDLRLSDAPDYVLEIFSRGHCIFKADLIHKKSRPNEAPIKHVLNVVLEDDVKFNLTYKSRRRDFRFKRKRRSFYFGFHTTFIEGDIFSLTHEELDKPYKPHRFSPDFKVQIEFDCIYSSSVDQNKNNFS